MNNQPAILQSLLGQFVAAEEAELYLRRFQALQGERPMLIQIGSGTLRHGMDDLVAAIGLLTSLGIAPMLIHDAATQSGPLLDDEPPERARTRLVEDNSQLIHALKRRHVHASGLTRGVFRVSPLYGDDSIDVRNQLAVDMALPERLLAAGIVPVVALMGECPSGDSLALPADAIVTLGQSARPGKIVLLTDQGMLYNRDRRCLTAISLTNDYDHLVVQSLVRADLQHLARRSYRLLEHLDSQSSVSITRPGRLIRELFSHGGSGTLVRKGEPLAWHDHVDAALARTLTDMLEESFGRRLDSGWLSRQEVLGVLLAQSGRGAALLLRGHNGIPYLDKLMVTPAARGEGLGAGVWQALLGRFPALYWRSRADNPINNWYFTRAESSHRSGRWVVFSTGISDFAALHGLTQDALARDSGWLEQRDS
ncbi:MAG: hypothetical protein EA370_07945 [Wenzhouxiangella sp.]|nr:MAG: hypothetical protein EA370_07945 [Wenzhouxiangella sp.]